VIKNRRSAASISQSTRLILDEFFLYLERTFTVEVMPLRHGLLRACKYSYNGQLPRATFEEKIPFHNYVVI